MSARVTRARARVRADENQVPVTPKRNVAKKKKPARAPLADRTNSASDENTSGHDVRKKPIEVEISKRPRRTQRPPAHLLEHQISPPHKEPSPVKVKVTPEPREVAVSLFKTPKDADTSIVGQRPRRLQRLPSRFSDHSLSPSNFTALKPSWASTPLPAKAKVQESRVRKNRIPSKEPGVKPVALAPVKKAPAKSNAENYALEHDDEKKPTEETTRPRRAQRIPSNISSPKKQTLESIPLPTSPQQTRSIAKYVAQSLKNRSTFKSNTSSPKLLTNRKSKVHEKLSVYEFTFDPSEEPKVPNKKMKKQTVRRKAAPRRVYIKDNYSKNVEKQLQSLKSMLSKKNATIGTQTNVEITTQLPQTSATNDNAIVRTGIVNTKTDNSKQILSHNLATQTAVVHSAIKPIDDMLVPKNTAVTTSADPKTTSNTIPPTEVDYHDEFPISYSPVSTPRYEPEAYDHPSTSNELYNMGPPNPAHNRDPLNLASDMSFFDKIPVASSSILSSRKSAEASPWRVDLEVHNKWPVNMYVKPNMTPAYESTFTNVEVDANVKNTHKYATGLFTDKNESSGYKQTSILSFIKEVDEKKNRKGVTPTKNNSVFDVSHTSSVASFHHPGSTPTRDVTPNNSKDSAPSPVLPEDINDPRNTFATPEKAKQKEMETKGVNEFFGFSDGEEDQENVSPKKKVIKPKSGRVLRCRAVLKELNKQKPMRLTTVPAKAYAPNSAVVNKMYEQLKCAIEAPVGPALLEQSEISACSEETLQSLSEASREVNEKSTSPTAHLFQDCDIDVVHHQKPVRKSYSKASKVAFQQSTVTDLTTRMSDDEDQGDVTFALPRVRDRRAPKRKKKQTHGMSAKEKEEVEKWAAGFHSMIEEANEFPLVIE